MKPRKAEKQDPNSAEVRAEGRKPKLRIIKLEERIAPKLSANHNETMVSDYSKAKPTDAKSGKDERKPKLRIVKLEERITPKIILNHNESMVGVR